MINYCEKCHKMTEIHYMDDPVNSYEIPEHFLCVDCLIASISDTIHAVANKNHTTDLSRIVAIDDKVSIHLSNRDITFHHIDKQLDCKDNCFVFLERMLFHESYKFEVHDIATIDDFITKLSLFIQKCLE